MTPLQRLGGALLGVVLAACAAGPRQDVPLPGPGEGGSGTRGADATDYAPERELAREAERWQAHRQAIEALDTWVARGKVAYRLPDEGGSANLNWDQAAGQTELRLSGPLGTASTIIRNDGPLISVQRDGIVRRYPADAAPWLPSGALLPIPIASLPYWLRGIPDHSVPFAELDLENGRARTLHQAGWIIHFDEYQEADGRWLPARLRIEAPDAGLVLRTLVRDWRFGDGGSPSP